MIRALLSLFVIMAVTQVWAADPDGRRPSETGAPVIINDLHDSPQKGLAMDVVATRDTDKFERNTTRAYTMVQYESIYDFIAVGASSDYFRQGGWSLRANSLVAQLRKTDRATAAGITARAAVAFVGDRTEFHGEGVWNIRFTKNTGVELIASRDAVESVPALQNGIMANFFGISLDHALTERLTVIGMPTYRRFSDGNEQTGLRGWIIYGLAPEHGLSLNIKARGYESSQNGGGAYFSPEHYERAEIGLRLRRAVGDWRVFATADVGRERINRDVEKPTSQLSLTAQRSFANDVSVGLQFAYYRASDTSNSSAAATDHYAWRMARLYVGIPF